MSKTIYTCSMHPEIQESAPGSCPKYGMKLARAAANPSVLQAWRERLALSTMCMVVACGGGQPPAESPEATSDTAETPATTSEPKDASISGADSHSMPDGTTMPGAEHEQKNEHQH